MLKACILEECGSWEKILPQVEFSYSNSSHSSIDMSPYEALYGRRCKTLLYWSKVGDRGIMGFEMIKESTYKIRMIREGIKILQSRQKSCADNRRRLLEFEEG